MLAIQGLCPAARILILAGEGSERGTRRRLAGIQVLRCFPLSVMAMYGRALIRKVQQ
jgi:fructose-bisphosphate aldolase class 1